jgi:hypothetical protein
MGPPYGNVAAARNMLAARRGYVIVLLTAQELPDFNPERISPAAAERRCFAVSVDILFSFSFPSKCFWRKGKGRGLDPQKLRNLGFWVKW